MEKIDDDQVQAQLLRDSVALDVVVASDELQAAEQKLAGLLEEQRVTKKIITANDKCLTLDLLEDQGYAEEQRRIDAEEAYWRTFPCFEWTDFTLREGKWSGPEPDPAEPWMRKPPWWGEWGPDGYIPPAHLKGVDLGEPTTIPPPAICSALPWCPAPCDGDLCGQECSGWCSRLD